MAALHIMPVYTSPQQTAALTVEQELGQNVGQVLQHAANYHASGQIKEAEYLYRAILEILPKHPDANHNLGLLEIQAQRPVAGLPYFEAALDACPEEEQYWLSYIDALIQSDQVGIARQVLELGRQHGLQGNAVEVLESQLGARQQAMTLGAVPKYEDKRTQLKTASSKKSAKKKSSHKSLGRAPSTEEMNTVIGLHNQGQTIEVEKLARSLSIRFPAHGFGWKILGTVLGTQGQVDEALLCLEKAASLLPTDAVVQHNLGITLKSRGRLVEAEASLRQALLHKPDYAQAHFNLGIILKEQNLVSEAIASYRRALALKPDYVQAHNNLANALHDQSKLSEAMKSYRRALEIDPNAAITYSNMLFCLSQIEGMNVDSLFTEHCQFGEQFETPVKALWSKHSNPREPERCLVIGFVSADFRNHALASFIEPVLSHLASNRNLSLHAYYNHTTEDSITQRLRGYFSHWHSVANLSDTAMEKEIRDDGIDILIDLSGHTGDNRLLVFARKPAPVQISWIGYPGTTGLSSMDYYITDRFLLPLGKFDSQFTEKLVYLPAGAPFLPSADAPPVNDLPALDNGHVTFGSFNRSSKISPAAIALWSQLLRALPTSRMVLGGMPQDGKYDMLIDWFAEEGIARQRLSFHPRDSMPGYLALHHQVDVCLDTFPYNGGTTTWHALWMGVPTLTLAGPTVAGRTGAGALGLVGLVEFIVQDSVTFVEQGLWWANHLSELATVRATLRERFIESSISQPALITAGLEYALRTMWQRWCADLPAASFQVSRADINQAAQGTKA